MEAATFYETSVTIYPLTQHYIPEDLNLQEFTCLQIILDTLMAQLLSRSGERKPEI
jgi:hypothetical protein